MTLVSVINFMQMMEIVKRARALRKMTEAVPFLFKTADVELLTLADSLFLKPTIPCTISAARCWLRGTAPSADTSRLYPSDPSPPTFEPLPRDSGTHHYHIAKPQLDYL
ncbi:hypothetical protein AVEN_131475-1 [Araneus ventricosus]|uniref:Uncharacterized protein n=1 Tax=Araneus ventricosus TaxID=182803 RepID=A0A4Y2F2U3_ARAVE|nr:hypothetical protein AVEN_131475-1 [Araneus ventricosus]